MNEAIEFSDTMRSIAQKGLRLLQQWKEHPAQWATLLEKHLDTYQQFQNMTAVLLKNPEQLWQMQMAYCQDALGLLQEQLTYWLEGKSMPIQDKRFISEEWVNHPFFNLLSQHYLLASEHLNALFEHLDYGDRRLAKRVQFFARQYLEALSPDNFLHTNPQLIVETLRSHGKNLLKGLDHFLTDLDAGSARLIMKMTDMDAFKVGHNLAITPGHVIFKNELMELIQYTPQTSKVQSIPLLIIPPWINKYYILDLSPENSLIRWLVQQGITVFVISWVNPDKSHANKGLYDYLKQGPETAIQIIQKQMNVKEVNALGFCIGGTLLALLLAYHQARQKQSVHSATFLAAMIDFSDPGDIAAFIDEQQVSKLEEKMAEKGYLEGHFMASAFNSLRASDLIWSFFIKHYLKGQTPAPFDILYWNADSTNMPAKMHSQYLRWMYLDNLLIVPRKIRLNRTPIDVARIEVPSFFVATQKDHIAPWQTVYLGYQALKGDKTFLLGGSGHIAGIINPPENNKYGYYLNSSTIDPSQTWLAQAEHHQGSWWPAWFDWLKQRSGRLINAPKQTSQPYPPLMDAPGAYVHQKT